MAALVWSVSVVSCSDDDGPNDPIITHVYLQVPDGNNSIVDGTDDAVTVQVSLSKAVDQNETFTFALEGENADMFVLGDNPVTVAAGTTSGFFTVKSANKLTITEAVTATFSITGLDEKKFDIASNISVKLLPAPGAGTLDPAKLALVAAWKEKYNIDILPWIGNVRLTGTIEFPGDGNREAFVTPETINLSGFTGITVSDDATVDLPAIDMVDNPMGMTDYLYTSLKKLTIEDNEYFALEGDGPGLDLMELIHWNATSEEAFNVTLPGIRLSSISDGKATLEFVKEGENFIYDSKGQIIHSNEYDMDLVYNYATSWIPFDYTYTAWDRQLGLVESGDALALELLTYSISAAPATYLGVNDVLEDYWAMDEEGEINLYVEPKGEIDFNAGTMTFEFPFDHADQYGYSRVKVTYTIEK